MQHNPNELYVRLPLQNAGNVRDLGGYPGDGGRATRFKAFLRSGSLSHLTAEEFQFLYDYGVRTILDLRSEYERESDKSKFIDERIKYIPVPFIVGNITVIPYEAENLNAMFDLYKYMLTECADMVAKAVKEIANAAEGTILYNCSAGKDRTGILSYILLSLAGVCEADIIANYQTTETYFLPIFKRAMPEFDKIPIQYLQSKAESMEQTIEFVKSNFGSIQKYLLGNNVTEQELALVKARII